MLLLAEHSTCATDSRSVRSFTERCWAERARHDIPVRGHTYSEEGHVSQRRALLTARQIGAMDWLMREAADPEDAVASVKEMF